MENYTNEQLKIINSKAKMISVESPPGSGKTYCILGIVKKHKDDYHLILAFNAAIKDSLKQKIEKEGITNAEVYTFHGLAYDFFKDNDIIKNFENRKIDNLDYFNLEDILKKLKIPVKVTMQYLNILLLFFRSKETLENFIMTVNWNINPEVTKERFLEILKYIKDTEECTMFHEYYIKLFQLMEFRNSRYKTVLVDESQDKTECYNSIIENLKTKRIIHFGDNFQKIYSYNGAMGMRNSKFRLTKSFRIGPDHAFICNSLIKSFITKNVIEFEGLNKNGEIVKNFSRLDRVTVISRTNKTMMERMLREIDKRNVVHIIGGEAGLGLDTIELIYTATKDNPKYYRGKRITSIKDAIELYVKTKSQDIKKALDFISDHKTETMKLVNIIRHKTIPDPNLADVCLVTAHKSKGLEFECVEIEEDFPKIEKLYEMVSIGKNIENEVFTLYVALSRSYGKLKLNKDLERWYEDLKERKDINNKPIVHFKKLTF